jgi:hypothetical protein
MSTSFERSLGLVRGDANASHAESGSGSPLLAGLSSPERLLQSIERELLRSDDGTRQSTIAPENTSTTKVT